MFTEAACTIVCGGCGTRRLTWDRCILLLWGLLPFDSKKAI